MNSLKKLIEKVLSNNYLNISIEYNLFKSENFQLASFKIIPIKVNHSLIEAVSFAIETPVGTIIHTGDWRIDEEPTNTYKTDEKKFKELGEKGILALFCDSTNAIKNNMNLTEQSVSEGIEDVFLTAKDRIVIATFSTQISRIKDIINLCKLFKKKIAVTGRSIENMVKISHEEDNTNQHQDVFISIQEINKIQSNQLVILTTGTQGEINAGLKMMSKNKHRFVKLNKKDTIVLSSSFIPGNENSINNLLNDLYSLDLKVVTYKDKNIHTSGHANSNDIRTLIDWVKPKYYIPIHGEMIQLISNKNIAVEKNIPLKNIFIIQNGSQLEFMNESISNVQKDYLNTNCQVLDTIKLKRHYQYGNDIFAIEEGLFEDKQLLADEGVCFLNIKLNNNQIQNISIASRGFLPHKEEEILFEKLKQDIMSFF